jgi:hypothetical protein
MVAHIGNQIFKEKWDKPEDQQIITSPPELGSRFYRIGHWDLRFMCYVLKDCKGVDLFGRFGISREPLMSDGELHRRIMAARAGQK